MSIEPAEQPSYDLHYWVAKGRLVRVSAKVYLWVLDGLQHVLQGFYQSFVHEFKFSDMLTCPQALNPGP